MQPQGDVGILGGILGGAIDRHFGEADLLGALAANFGVGDRRDVEMAARERIHVARAVALQHVGLEQRVVGDTAEPNAVVGEHVGVVLEILADLGVPVRLQPRLETRQHPVEGELRRPVGEHMGQRQVGRLARRHGKRHADQARRHRIETGGLGIEGGELGAFDRRQPAVERRFVQDCDVVARIAGVGAVGAGPGFGPIVGGRRALPALEFGQPAAEFEPAVKVAEPLAVAFGRRQRRQFHRQVDRGVDGHQAAAEGQKIEVLAQILADLAADLVGPRHQCIEIAVLMEPLDRGLRSALVDTGHVVDGVADQCQVVDDA